MHISRNTSCNTCWAYYFLWHSYQVIFFMFNMDVFDYFYAVERERTTKSLNVSNAVGSWTDLGSIHDSARGHFLQMILPWRPNRKIFLLLYHFPELEQCNRLTISGPKMKRINQVAIGKAYLQAKILISSIKLEPNFCYLSSTPAKDTLIRQGDKLCC